jgi:hypothetical protein
VDFLLVFLYPTSIHMDAPSASIASLRASLTEPVNMQTENTEFSSPNSSDPVNKNHKIAYFLNMLLKFHLSAFFPIF